MSAKRNASPTKKSFAEVAAAAAKEATSAGEEDVAHLGTMLKEATLVEQQQGKITHSDTKSITLLDEKESLRPDDSASMQAAPEEESNFSPSGSVLAGSSDPDIRAFRDQLYEIDRTGGNNLKAAPTKTIEQRNGGIIFTTPPATASPFNPTAVVPVIPPDEKLLEALASPKDRLFVLKIEQDMIDFVKDSKEEFLQLPQTNSFYRMLSHKLADYYLLGHVIDESMTSVRIYRTPTARLPPPLIGLEAVEGRTPPTRKIMRRGAAAAQDSSNDASKATSEAGSDGETPSSSKGLALTREERENRYKEARARIFKDFNEDDVQASAEKEMSRSSSTTRKNKLKDDTFEARSAYSQYGGQAFVPKPPPPPFFNQQPQYGQQYPTAYPMMPPPDPYGHWYAQQQQQQQQQQQDLYNQSTPKPAHLTMHGYPGFDNGYQGYASYDENFAPPPQMFSPLQQNGYAQYNNLPQYQGRFNPQTQAFIPSFQTPVAMGWQIGQHQQAMYRNNNRMMQPNKAPPLKQSSISKWGAPATLPPKPPPPATSLSFQIPKNSESQQPLPPHPFSHS